MGSTLRKTLFGTVSALVLMTTAAVAQDDQSVETVVVTGSRIPRAETDVANPVTTIDSIEIAHSGTTNLTDYLKRIPALTGSMGDYQTTGYNTPASADGSSLAGLNLLDLRNLGYVRTLVLIDGHRTVGASTGSVAVDIGSIPITLIDRVEVVTGGSSAVYGADGVSGVVNFIMKHDLEGVEARAQVGTSQDGGGSKYLGAASIGHNFAGGKGNVTLTLEESHQDHLFFTQRSFTDVGGYSAFVPNPADPNDDPRIPDNILTRDAQFVFSAPTGAVTTRRLNLNTFVPDHLGNGDIFNPGTDVGGGSAIGSSGMPFADDLQGDFQPNENRTIAQASGDYEFASWLKLSGEFKFAQVNSEDSTTAPFDDEVVLRPDNAFLPANLAALMRRNIDGLGILSEDYLDLRNREKVDRNTYRGVLDISGALPSPSFITNLHYDASYVYGQSDIDDIIPNNRVTDRFFAALDSVIDPATGKPTCRSNLNPADAPLSLSLLRNGFPGFSDTTSDYDPTQFATTFAPGPNSGCVPFNPFDPKADNRASIAFVTQSTDVKGFLSQQVFNGFISADIPFVQDLGMAKPLSIVMGGEYRIEKSKSTPEAITEVPGLFWNGGTLPVAGSFNVSEEFGEASLPVIADKPFVKELTFDVAGRLSSYSTAGDSQSWKLDGIYSPISGLKFRGTAAVAVRAPNIGELFAPNQKLFAFVNDPCDFHFINDGTSFRAANCQAIENAVLGPGKYVAGKSATQTDQTTPNVIGGNSDLAPETARTQTLGVVLQPDFLEDFVATVDWYRVTIRNAIEAPSAQDVANECVDLSSINNPFCAQIQRTATGAFPGAISLVTSKQINVASFFTQGIDFTANYHVSLDKWFDGHYGALDFHLIGNHLDSILTTPLPGEAPIQSANTIAGGVDGTPTPYWQFNLDTVWTIDKWTIDYNIDWYNGVLLTDRQTIISQPDFVAKKFLHLAPRNIHSMQVDYAIGDGWDVYAGVDNLFYQKPSPGQDAYPVDPIGRFFYMGVKANIDL